MKRKKTAFLTGITGMAGSHLAEFLLEKDYKVYGLIRRTSANNKWRIANIIDKIDLLEGDILDSASLEKAIKLIQPDEVYNLAAQSFVKHSFEAPEYTGDVTGLGALRLVEAVKNNHKTARVYHASSSEMFGKTAESPQNENTPFYPRSPYGCAKVFAHWLMKNYRESFNMFICCGINFNMESERRGTEFVTRKVTLGVAKIKNKLQSKIELGNIDTKRDWGYAPEYMQIAWQMLQHHIPDDYVIATGETHSIKEWIVDCFKYVGIENWRQYITITPQHFRPSEVDCLCGDATKARTILGWKPLLKFKHLVDLMMRCELQNMK